MKDIVAEHEAQGEKLMAEIMTLMDSEEPKDVLMAKRLLLLKQDKDKTVMRMMKHATATSATRTVDSKTNSR